MDNFYAKHDSMHVSTCNPVRFVALNCMGLTILLCMCGCMPYSIRINVGICKIEIYRHTYMSMRTKRKGNVTIRAFF
jgi:hypothetical protein